MQENERINSLLIEKTMARTVSGIEEDQPTAIAGFNLYRREHNNSNCMFYRPFIGLTLQGHKHSTIGKKEYAYGKYACVVAGVDAPSQSYITVASEQEPFLAMSISLDRPLVARLATEMHFAQSTPDDLTKSVAVMEADTKLMNTFLRLLELLDDPEEIPIMAPMLLREIHYRVLLGPQGAWLRSLCAVGSASNQIARAITWLRENFRAPLQIDDLASQVGMSSSSFFRHFKQITTLSPLQFQKTLRLYEAQRLLLGNEFDVANAAYAVGNESPTQFIREYKRMFGEPPHRDVTRRRGAIEA